MTQMDINSRKPSLRSQNPEMIPKALLLAMAALALSTLAIVTASVVADRPHVGVPAPSTMLRERFIVLEGLSAQAVVVRDVDGTVLLDLPHGGFVTVIQSGVFTERRKHGVDQTKPVRIVEYANRRLVVEDPETGWSAELYAFGGDNKAAFEALLDKIGTN